MRATTTDVLSPPPPSAARTILAAVEGGGTSTTLLVVDTSQPGRIYRASGGTTNPFLVASRASPVHSEIDEERDHDSRALAFPAVAAVVLKLLRQALLLLADGSPSCTAQDGNSAVHAMVLAISGFGRRADAAALERDLRQLGAATQCRVSGDADAPARCVRAAGRFPPGDTIVLISGTGSAAFRYGTSLSEIASDGGASLGGQREDGLKRAALQWSARAGGRGHVLGDQGSAYWIGREALSRALMAHDEGKHTPGTAWVAREAVAHYGLTRFEEIVRVAQHQERGKTSVAGFARVVAEGASLHDGGGDASGGNLFTGVGKDGGRGKRGGGEGGGGREENPDDAVQRRRFCASIMEEAGRWLGRLLASAMRKKKPAASMSARTAVPAAAATACSVVVLVGSVWKSWEYIGPALVQRLANAHQEDVVGPTNVMIVRLEETCALGGLHAAALLAGPRACGVAEEVRKQVAGRISESLVLVEEVRLE